MRVCCGLTNHLELAKRPDLYGGPVVVGEWEQHVIAASEETLQFGVLPDMPLRQAEHLCPQATFIAPDPDAAARRRLRAAIGREPRLGLAPGPFSARMAAARARPGRLIQVEDARAFLAPLASRELPLDEEQLERLDLLGLRTLGAVASIGPRELESQLGSAGRHAALLARGAEPDELTSWRPPQFTSAHRQFEPPVEDREALLFVSRALCGDLAAELGLRGAGAKQVRVRLVYESGEPDERDSIVRHPLSSAVELFGLIGSWIKEWQPRAPLTELWIELPVLEAAGRRQLRLWAGGDGTSEEVIAALERLQERHGDGVVRKPHPALLTSPLPAQRFA